MPDSPEGACSTAAVVVAWTCVGFMAAVAALAQSVVWTILAAVGLVVTVGWTLAVAERPAYRADSAPVTARGELGEDDERVGSW